MNAFVTTDALYVLKQVFSEAAWQEELAHRADSPG